MKITTNEYFLIEDFSKNLITYSNIENENYIFYFEDKSEYENIKHQLKLNYTYKVVINKNLPFLSSLDYKYFDFILIDIINTDDKIYLVLEPVDKTNDDYLNFEEAGGPNNLLLNDFQIEGTNEVPSVDILNSFTTDEFDFQNVEDNILPVFDYFDKYNTRMLTSLDNKKLDNVPYKLTNYFSYFYDTGDSHPICVINNKLNSKTNFILYISNLISGYNNWEFEFVNIENTIYELKLINKPNFIVFQTFELQFNVVGDNIVIYFKSIENTKIFSKFVKYEQFDLVFDTDIDLNNLPNNFLTFKTKHSNTLNNSIIINNFFESTSTNQNYINSDRLIENYRFDIDFSDTNLLEELLNLNNLSNIQTGYFQFSFTPDNLNKSNIPANLTIFDDISSKHFLKILQKEYVVGEKDTRILEITDTKTFKNYQSEFNYITNSISNWVESYNSLSSISTNSISETTEKQFVSEIEKEQIEINKNNIQNSYWRREIANYSELSKLPKIKGYSVIVIEDENFSNKPIHYVYDGNNWVAYDILALTGSGGGLLTPEMYNRVERWGLSLKANIVGKNIYQHIIQNSLYSTNYTGTNAIDLVTRLFNSTIGDNVVSMGYSTSNNIYNLGDNSIFFGSNLKTINTTPKNMIAIGSDLISGSNYNIAIGNGLNLSTKNKIVIGNYNNPKNNSIFEIGFGTSSANTITPFWIEKTDSSNYTIFSYGLNIIHTEEEPHFILTNGIYSPISDYVSKTEFNNTIAILSNDFVVRNYSILKLTTEDDEIIYHKIVTINEEVDTEDLFN